MTRTWTSVRAATSRRIVRSATLVGVLLVAAQVPIAHGAEPAYFPAIPPPTQIMRELTLEQAARAGAVRLQAKGGSEGDAVSLELEGKRTRAPIVIMVRVEITVPARLSAESRAVAAKLVPEMAQAAEGDLNRMPTKTKSGDPLRFKLDFAYRDPEAPPRSNYHQISLVDKRFDHPDDPEFRSGLDAVAVPNSSEPRTGEWEVGDMKPAGAVAHETLHLIGLADRYADVYVYRGQRYPLPRSGMDAGALKRYLRSHHPPLPPPPAGRVGSVNAPGTSRCDMMGTGTKLACRRLSQRDTDWLESQAGLLVVAEPGQTLLDKSPEHQNFGIGFRTIVFAAPGSTTVANGVSVYCLDHDRLFPIDQVFDVGPPAASTPGYEGVAKLLALNAGRQPDLSTAVPGMQAAIWNLTDAAPLASSGSEDEARSLMSEAGVGEDAVPGGLAAIANPNAGNPDSGSVDATGTILGQIPTSAATPPPPFRLHTAALYPSRLYARRRVRADLLLGVTGDVATARIVVQKRLRKRWRTVRRLPRRALGAGTVPLQLALGRLAAGKHRLLVSVSGPPGGRQQTLAVLFLVRRAR